MNTETEFTRGLGRTTTEHYTEVLKATWEKTLNVKDL